MPTIKVLYSRDLLPLAEAAESLAVGDLVYLNGSGKWAKADADASGKYPAIGVVVKEVNPLTGYPTVARRALFRNFGSGMTKGTVYYLSTTAGGVTATAPTNNKCVQQVAFAESATDMQFVVQPTFYMAKQQG